MQKLISSILLSILLFIPLTSQQQTFTYELSVAQDFSKQILCMAKNLYYEAAMESYEGKLAVAQVTMNRANSSKFPSDVCAVVYQKVNNTYQFSWVGEKVSEVRNKYAWEECLHVARRALTEKKLHDTIYKTQAMYYHNTSVKPGWNLRYVAKIGNHLFYTRT